MFRARHFLTEFRSICAAAFAFATLVLHVAPAGAADSAVVLMYHRFGEPTHTNSNISIDLFEAHIAELRTGGYTVLPVSEIVAALKSGRALPERTVGITMDDAYLSIYQEAWPRLKAAGFPATLFVSPGPVDQARRGYMGWAQIRELMADGVTIGHHTMWHRRLQEHSRDRVQREIDEATARFQEELHMTPTLFSYPHGEYSVAARQIVIDAGFAAAFSQHSGVVHTESDMYALPRFTFTDEFADMERFRLAVNALPLRISELIPQDPVLVAANNPPFLGFTVAPGVDRLDRLACYVSNRGKAQTELLPPNRIEVRVSDAFPPGRVRFNCTLREDGERWRWLGVQYIVPEP